MTKKRILLFSGIGIFVVAAVLIYWFYFSEPEAIPEEEELLEGINELFPEAFATAIQDIIPIDDKHLYVPYISEQGDYSKSFWTWEHHKWKVAYIDTKGRPLIWKINRNTPASYHIVWNIHPDDQQSYMKYYLIRDRGYRVTEGVESYNPRVQMEATVSLAENSYGVLKMPEDWVSFVNSFIKVESKKQPGVFSLEQYMYFGWTLYNRSNEASFPEKSVNGNTYSIGSEVIDYIMILDEAELESPVVSE